MPEKHKKFTNGKLTYTGVDAHRAVLNLLMLQKLRKQVGRGKYPHIFRNRPYEEHPDPALNGKTPIPATHTNMPEMYEYPIKPGTTFLGMENQRPGPARVVVSANAFHGVISHDRSRLGTDGDHYLMNEVDR